MLKLLLCPSGWQFSYFIYRGLEIPCPTSPICPSFLQPIVQYKYNQVILGRYGVWMSQIFLCLSSPTELTFDLYHATSICVCNNIHVLVWNQWSNYWRTSYIKKNELIMRKMNILILKRLGKLKKIIIDNLNFYCWNFEDQKGTIWINVWLIRYNLVECQKGWIPLSIYFM